MAGFPLAGTYRTPEGVTANVMEKLGADWDGWAAHDDTYVVDGENVVVLARYTARHRTTGKALAVRVAHHFVVRGGLIVRFEQFVDTALVRDAASEVTADLGRDPEQCRPCVRDDPVGIEDIAPWRVSRVAAARPANALGPWMSRAARSLDRRGGRRRLHVSFQATSVGTSGSG